MSETEKSNFSIELFLRKTFKSILDKIAGFLINLGLKPNIITISGLIGNIVAAILIGWGKLFWGGLLAMLVGPFDALDGAMARLKNEPSKYGSFIDSVTDRYDELVLLAGLLVHFIMVDEWIGCVLVYFAAVGSVMVSFVRAKAEALGYSAKVGILTRVERYLILIPGIILGKPMISLAIIALLGNITAIQRFYFVRKQALKDSIQ